MTSPLAFGARARLIAKASRADARMEATRADRAESAGAPVATARQSALLTAVKAMGLAATAGLSAALAVRLVGSIHSVSGVAAVVAGSLAGYLLADLSSGTVHWFCDTFFSETTPIVGRRLIQPFREHHVNPQEITTCSMLEQDASSYMSLIPVLWLVRSWAPVGSAALLAQAALLGLAIGTMGTNVFHKWAHTSDPPAAVRWLQRRRWILSPEAHAVHHRSYDGGYCVTSGWMNAVLDRVRFFPRLELVVRSFLPRPRGDVGAGGATASNRGQP